MFKMRFKNKASAGFAHHFGLAALLLIVGFAVYGTYQLVASHADSFSFSVQTKTGCKMSGRVWNDDTSSCTKTCQNSSSTYNTNGTAPSYCSGYVVKDISLDTCTNTLHRRYVQGIGCARRPDRVNTDNAIQCQNAYPNYMIVTGSDPDKCVVKSVETTTATTGGTTTGSTATGSSSTSTGGTTASTGGTTSTTTTKTATTGTTTSRAASDPISQSVCTTLLGRIYANGACQRVCQPINANTKTLLAVPAPDNAICNGWVAANISQTKCTVGLHRMWRDNGCLRHMPQVDTNNAAQCLAGYPYYNANFTSPKGSTGMDVCEKSAAAARYNEAHDILGSPISTGNSNTGNSATNTGTNGTSSGSGTNDGASTDPIILPITSVSKTIKVESLSRNVCDLLGREWVPAGKDTAGNKVAAGCSTESCFKNNVDLHKRNGSYYCDGYATGAIAQQKCGDLHRQWIAVVEACASRPNQNAKAGARAIEAPQCVGSYSTYVFRTNQYDECLKPGTVDNLKNVARVANLPFVKVTTLSRAGLCNALPHKHWNGHGCVKDRTIQHTSTAPANSGTDHPASGFSVTKAFCNNTLGRPYANGTCARACLNAAYYLPANNASSATHGYDKCVKQQVGSNQCSNPDTVSGTCTGQTPQTLTYKKLSCADFNRRFPHTAVCPTAQTSNIDSNKPGTTTYHCSSGKTGIVSRQVANVIYRATACTV